MEHTHRRRHCAAVLQQKAEPFECHSVHTAALLYVPASPHSIQSDCVCELSILYKYFIVRCEWVVGSRTIPTLFLLYTQCQALHECMCVCVCVFVCMCRKRTEYNV